MKLVRSDGVPVSKDVIYSVEAFMETADAMSFFLCQGLGRGYI